MKTYLLIADFDTFDSAARKNQTLSTFAITAVNDAEYFAVWYQ
jgi:hypothetical protein